MLSMNFLNAIIEFPNAIAGFSYRCFCNTLKSGQNVILKKISPKKIYLKKKQHFNDKCRSRPELYKCKVK